MKNNIGFIELKSVSDYWKKLQFDFQQLKKNPENTYIGFNFFVTSYHLIDWIFEGQYNTERTELNKNPVIKICNHIANGVKHFETKRHKSVKKIEKSHLFEQGFFEDGLFESPIIIHFENEYFSEFGETMSITEIANRINQKKSDIKKLHRILQINYYFLQR